jgi:hypothetical protein
MIIKYFKLQHDFTVVLPDKIEVVMKKDGIFHIQSQYVSPLTSEQMVIIAIDKCTPIAVPINSGTILD